MITTYGCQAMFGGTQEELLSFILTLKSENPEMEIKFCVDNSELSDEGAWTTHKISRVEISPFWYRDDEWIETDVSTILDELEERVWEDFGFSDVRAKALAEMRYAEEVKYAICVFTCAAY
jgi:hypothetical protein